MGYLTTDPTNCRVYLSNHGFSGHSTYYPGLPSPASVIGYSYQQWNSTYPQYTLPIPAGCQQAPPSSPPPSVPTPPAPQPPAEGEDIPTPGPVTGDPPPEDCGEGSSMILPDGDSWSRTGVQPSRTKGHGAIDQLAQPAVVAMIPLPTYDSSSNVNGRPVYTQEPYFEIRTGPENTVMDVFHEGTGEGALVFAPPEMQDYQIVGGEGAVETDTLSTSLILLLTRAAAGAGDDPTMRLGFGDYNKRFANKPASGGYFELDPGGFLEYYPTNSSANTDNDFGIHVYGHLWLEPVTLNSSPSAGMIAIDSGDSNTLKWYDGSSWQSAGGGGGVSFPLQAPDTAGAKYSFDGTITGSDSAGMGFDQDTQEGPALYDINGAVQLRVADGVIEIPNKLTVGGLIDPTGLELTPGASNPGGDAGKTLWMDNGTTYTNESFVLGDSASPVVVPGLFNVGSIGSEQNSVSYVGTTQMTRMMISDQNDSYNVLQNFHKHSTGTAFTDGGVVAFSRSRSTGVSHGALNANDWIGSILWAGHDGTDYNPVARFGVRANSAFNANDTPGYATLDLSPEGSNSLAEVMRWKEDGDVDIPNGALDVGDYNTTIQNLINGASTRTPSATDPLAVYDTGTGGGKVTIENMVDVVGASQSEMESASSAKRIVTPDIQHHHPGHPKFWARVNVASGTPSLDASYNVTSITDIGTGQLNVTIATDFSSENWCCTASVEKAASGSGNGAYVYIENAYPNAGLVRVVTRRMTGGSGSEQLWDPDAYHVVGHGDQ